MAEVKGSYVGGTPVYFKDERARAMLSNEYVPAENYTVGNLCIHEGKLYKATKVTTGTWDATAWTETNLAEVNAGMQKSITDLTDKTQNITQNAYTLLNNISLTANTEQTISLHSDRSFDDFEDGALIFGTFLPSGSGFWRTLGVVQKVAIVGDKKIEFTFMAQSTLHYLDLTYVSPTKVTVKSSVAGTLKMFVDTSNVVYK